MGISETETVRRGHQMTDRMTDRKTATATMTAPCVLVNLAQETDDDFIWGRLEDMVVAMASVGALINFS